MRRQGVPPVEVAADSSGLEVLLRSPEYVPVYDRKLQPLDGVRWPRGAVREPLPGEVALFDVVDAGELQEW